MLTKRFLAVFLSCLMASAAFADGNVFTKVRYNGGSAPSKVDPKDWGNKLTVSPDKSWHHWEMTLSQRPFG